jgi:hypothetical protein
VDFKDRKELLANPIIVSQAVMPRASIKKRAAPAIGLPSFPGMSAGLWVYLGQICQGLFDILVRVEFDVLQLAIQEGVVGRQVEVAVAR